MALRIGVRRTVHGCAFLALAFLLGCGKEDANPLYPPSNAPPIQIRADAATYGEAGGFKIEGVELAGRTLKLSVSYSGGCRTHTFAAAAPPSFLASDPPQLPVFIRHEADTDPCLAIGFETLTFDVTPAVRLRQQTLGYGPFYLLLFAPGDTEHPQVLVPSDPHF